MLAPADAGVVSVRDGLSDNRPWVETNPAEPAGNHVILDLGHTEYAVLAHFQRGSIRVAEGGRVHAGDILGLCGNSGNSSEPHVHFHVQDKPTFFADGAVGIPVRFGRFLADGVPSHKATPTSGQFLTADVSANAGRP
ncbi:MAG TPA: M23 family metallopeptidase [Acidimicrobiales bacterium]|nr:M23 family metallopeptidase [Acidimicrobiales bacterium]